MVTTSLLGRLLLGSKDNVKTLLLRIVQDIGWRKDDSRMSVALLFLRAKEDYVPAIHGSAGFIGAQSASPKVLCSSLSLANRFRLPFGKAGTSWGSS